MKRRQDLKSNTWEKYSSAQTLQKKKNDSLFFFKAFTLPRIGETKYTTSSILTRYYNGRLYHLCIFTHAYSKGPHAHKALQGVSSVSRIPSKATTNYTLIALVKIGETFQTFSFDFFPPPKLSMKSAFIKVQNTFQHLTYEVVNDYDTPYWGGRGPKKNKQKKPKNGRVIAEPTLQAHETRLTNRTFVLQRSQRTEEENEMTKHSVSKIYIVHILG